MGRLPTDVQTRSYVNTYADTQPANRTGEKDIRLGELRPHSSPSILRAAAPESKWRWVSIAGVA